MADVTSREAAHFLREHLAGLAIVANEHDLKVLSYLISMALLEADGIRLVPENAESRRQAGRAPVCHRDALA